MIPHAPSPSRSSRECKYESLTKLSNCRETAEASRRDEKATAALKIQVIFIYLPPDPRTSGWPLMSDPLPMLSIVIFYNYFVQKIGPALMANRKPFQLNRTLIVYNFVQVLVSCYLFYEVSVSTAVAVSAPVRNFGSTSKRPPNRRSSDKPSARRRRFHVGDTSCGNRADRSNILSQCSQRGCR